MERDDTYLWSLPSQSHLRCVKIPQFAAFGGVGDCHPRRKLLREKKNGTRRARGPEGMM